MAVLSSRISGGAFANQGAPLRHQTMGFPVGKRNGDPGPGTLLEAGSEVRKVAACRRLAALWCRAPSGSPGWSVVLGCAGLSE